jgi:hypothetical protein
MAWTCNICDSNTVEDEQINCSKCSVTHHIKCVNLSKLNSSVIKIIKKSSDIIKWYCPDCEKYLNNIEKNINEMKLLLKQNMDSCQKMFLNFSEKLKIFENKLCDNVNMNSYASAVKKPVQNPVVLLKPKIDQENKITQASLKMKVDPRNVPINGILNASKGAVILKCKNNDAVEVVKEQLEEKMGDDYEISVPHKKNPRIKILNVTVQEDESEIPEILFKQNDEFFENVNEIKFVKAEKVRNKDTEKHFVVEINAKSYEKILVNSTEKKLNYRWNRCKVVDAVEARRCYHCCEYSHFGKECKNKRCCPICSLEHKLNECNSDIEKCGNCDKINKKLKLKLDVNHAVWDKSCPVYMRKITQIKRSIKYE